MKPLFSLVCLLASALPAQLQATVPNVPSSSNVDRPFAGGIGRYQQWFSAASVQAQFTEPLRIETAEFFAGTSQSSTAAMLDMEVLMSNGKFSGLTSQFDTNYDNTPVVVMTRQMVQLAAVGPGAVALTVPFSTRFTWDHVHPLLLEIRIYGNSLGSQPFTYNHRGVTTLVGQTSRVYQGGSPVAPNGLSQQGVGMIVRFTARQGVVLDYGTGCPGQGGFVPVNTAVQVPTPGITWSHRINNAAPQAIALWIIGDSDTMIDSVGLPLDLTQALGYPASGCMLRANMLGSFFGVTVGGGAGSGFLQFGLPLPVLPLGVSLYSQWIVFDPFSPNGVLAVTQGVHSITGT